MTSGGCKNFIDKSGLINNVYSGDLTLSVLKKTEEELAGLAEKLRNAGERVLVLTDISKIGKVPTKVRQKGVEIIRSLDYDKAALFGDEGFGMQIAKLIIKVSMMDYKIKIFNNEKDAKDWLQRR